MKWLYCLLFRINKKMFVMSTFAFYLVGEGEIIIDIPYYCYKLLVPASHKELSYFGGI